jgi:hypothetical protein
MLRLMAGLIFAALLILNPTGALDAARQALGVWATSFVPALLPFFAVTPALSSDEAAALYSRLLGRPFGALFGCPGHLAGAALIGLMAGSPAGAIAAGRLRRRATGAQLTRAALLASGVSPGFLISAVGASMLGDANLGAILLRSLLGALGIGGLILRCAFSDDPTAGRSGGAPGKPFEDGAPRGQVGGSAPGKPFEGGAPGGQVGGSAPGKPFEGGAAGGQVKGGRVGGGAPDGQVGGGAPRGQVGGGAPRGQVKGGRAGGAPGEPFEGGAAGGRAGGGALMGAALSMLSVGAHMVVFAVAARLIAGFLPPGWEAGVLSAMEVSGGCAAIADLPLATAERLILLAFFCGFGGLSIMAQNLRRLDGVRLRDYFFGKLLHGALCALLCWGQIGFALPAMPERPAARIFSRALAFSAALPPPWRASVVASCALAILTAAGVFILKRAGVGRGGDARKNG